jgi:hypothetical protein
VDFHCASEALNQLTEVIFCLVACECLLSLDFDKKDWILLGESGKRFQLKTKKGGKYVLKNS